MLKLMYITNNPDVALVAESAGVDRIFVDMEYIGKSDRQGGMDTVQSKHTISDVITIRNVITKCQLMVRCNPMHGATNEFTSSKQEIDAVIAAGADVIMLPYFKTAQEVRDFVRIVDGRAITLPLVETPEAVNCIDEILAIDGIDEIFVGLNDLSLGYGKKFMFELLVDGTVEMLCEKFKQKGIPYGFGGIASLGKGMLPAEYIIKEHYRLGSSCVILSRSFCNTSLVDNIDAIRNIFEVEIDRLRRYEAECEKSGDCSRDNMVEIEKIIEKIIRDKE